MPEVKLIYQSSSGHAYSVAKAVGNELNTKPIDIHEPAVLSDTDLLILCIETRDGKTDHYMLDYLDQLPINRSKDAALISTSLSGRDYTELAVGLLGHKGISVYPKRLCLKRGIMRFFRSRPNESDLKEARLFAREVAAACGQ